MWEWDKVALQTMVVVESGVLGLVMRHDELGEEHGRLTLLTALYGSTPHKTLSD